MHPDLAGFQRLETLQLDSTVERGARFTTDAGPLTAEFFAPGILRLRLGPPDPPDYGLLVASPDAADVRATALSDGHRLEFGDLALELHPSPLRFRITVGGKTRLASTQDGHIQGSTSLELRLPPLARRDDEWLVALELPSGDPVYGLGEKFGPLDRRGQLVDSWNEDALGVNAELSYKNAPFAWSPSGWGLFVHTPARVLHGVGYPQWSHRSYILRVQEPTLDLFILAADSPAALLERYTHLTGRAPVPPLWGFGVWMSRLSYRLPDEILAIANKLRDRRIPCDVFLLDGRVWLEVKTRFLFEWDRSRYPDPEGFVNDLRALDFHICNWEYPLVSIHNPLFQELADKGLFLRTADGDTYIYHWDPAPFGALLTPLPSSGIVDFTNPDAYAWWRDAHKPLFDMGIAMMKTDFGEQVPTDAVAHNGDTGHRLHNVYPLLYNRCVYEASERYAPDGPMVWGRSGWTGSQRYPVQWGGDSQTDWSALAASVRGGLSWGLTGVPYQTSDIGGFYGPMPDPELFVRWTQVGVMNSHTRFHGTSPREPWEYGAEAERVVRDWLDWRYRLLPYIEACAHDAAQSGLPIMRAMPLAFPNDRPSWAFDEQYMFGPALLVAPVLRPGGEVRVYLPPGAWYDIWTGERLVGPQLLERVMPLDQIPIYGREGYFLPLGPAVQHTGQLRPDARVDELRLFGLPQPTAALPNLPFTVDATRSTARLRNLPPAARLIPLGPIHIDHTADAATISPSA